MSTNAPPANQPDVREGIRIRKWLTVGVTVGGGLGVMIVGGITIWADRSNAMLVFNVLVPVFAGWVGTVLTFYYGVATFETANNNVREITAAANQQVREMNKQAIELVKLSLEERIQQTASTIMRSVNDMFTIPLAAGQDETSISIAEMRGLRDAFIASHPNANITRTPILNAENKPLYMIHDSVIDKYLTGDGKKETDSLRQFLDNELANNRRYDNDHGYVVVSETATIGEAKAVLEGVQSVQDIFITPLGTNNEPLSGWISNIRLSEYLKP